LFDAQDLGIEATRTILGFVRKSVEAKYGVTTSTAAASTTTTSAREVKMCVAEEGRDMSDFEEEDTDEVMI
jgi:hypothetical protein